MNIQIKTLCDSLLVTDPQMAVPVGPVGHF